jgi:hypothetical protein
MISLPDEEWRVEIDLDDERHGYPLSERLRALDLDDEARERLGGRVIVTRDGPHLFLYAASEEGAREAEQVIRRLLDQDRLTADVSVTRWDPAAEEWVPVTEPAAAKRPRPPRAEEHDWFLLVEPAEGAGAAALAERLRSDGHPVERRWRYLLVGAASEEDANALADRLRAELGPGARVEVRAAVDIPSPAFVLLEALKPGIARDLGL